MNDIITLDYGSGGRKTSELINEMILTRFPSKELSVLGDGAVIHGFGDIVMSTDSFVVNPLFFPGGNIGKLAVTGTVNDILMSGGIPMYISLALIIEEGFATSDLSRILDSVKETAEEAGVQVVTGDTKVVERGKADGIYINTAGIGKKAVSIPGTDSIRVGDKVIASGTLGEHASCIMLERENLGISASIKSDCALLIRETEILRNCPSLRIMRDPTRGGVSEVLNEFISGSIYTISLSESSLPLSNQVKSITGLLGLDPLYCACEGRCLAIVGNNDAATVINSLKHLSSDACIIGEITQERPGSVILNTTAGTRRLLSRLSGAQLPRIC